MSESKAQGVIFPDLAKKPVEVQFDLPMATSDGGAMLLKAADQALNLSTTLASCLPDRRESHRVQHDLVDLLRQRMYSIALGYEDANDARRLKDDAMHQSLVRGSCRETRRLASQPTLRRFENAVSRTACYRLSSALADGVLARHRRRLRRVKKITIDLDGSVDRTHGGQQLSLFSGFYGTWCYLPLFGFLTFNEEAEQYLFAAMLRPGAINERLGALGVLRRILQRVRASFPKARILVRLDAGFAGPEMFDFLEQQPVDYVVAMPRNRVLEGRAAVSLSLARSAAAVLGETCTAFGDTRYAARSWHGKTRRVIYKAEVLRGPGMLPRDNMRFVVTNLRQKPETVYNFYTGRGDAENRIKELKDGLQVDRTSCHGFWANQFRVLLTAAAYLLFQEIRLRARRTSLARAQVNTLRLALLKIGGLVRKSCRRVAIRLTLHHPWQNEWLRVARALGAIPPPVITTR